MLSGTKLGKYEIRQKIGSGGMGEVYRAHDSALDRNVALKVLLPEFLSDSDRVDRFRHEARAASALNHPNIITIHEVGNDNDCFYIATEFVDGVTLREKIARHELTQTEAIRITEQIADALAVAHESHITHRDIKPENIMIRHDGIVKILDFGLAKPIFRKKIGAEDETVRLVETQPGLVMGSVRYMSPEQARGKDTDQRTDVWSLGVVLYEMLTGTNPFQGETISDSLAAVLHVEPPPVEDAPEELQRILRKSLRKNAADRYQSIKDMALDLREFRLGVDPVSGESRVRPFSATTSINRQNTDENKALLHNTATGEQKTTAASLGVSNSLETSAGFSTGRRYVPAALILTAIVLALGGWFVLPRLLVGRTPAFQSIQASRLTDTGTAMNAEISPDGRFVAYIERRDGKTSLAVKQISTGTTMTVVQPVSKEFYQPAFSHDGDFIYYVLIDNRVGTLYKVSTLGGDSRKIIVDVDSKVTFSPDGSRMAFIRHDPNEGGDTVYIAEADGSSPQPFIRTKDTGVHQFAGVDWSPDGERLVVGVFKDTGDPNRRMQVALASIATGNIEFLGGRYWYGIKNLEWLRDGSGVVMVAKSDLGENSQVWHMSYPGGEPRQITTDTSDYASVSVSGDGGTIVTTRVDMISSLWSMEPQTRSMKQLTVENKNLLGYYGLAQAVDGRLLITKATGKDVNIFSVDPSGMNEKQLTSEQGTNLYPSSSPNGETIVFASNRGGSVAIWKMNADGTQPVQLTDDAGVIDIYPLVTKDGKYVMFSRQTIDGGKVKLMVVPLEGGQEVAVMPENKQSEIMPRLSTDGTRLIYHSFDFDDKTANFVSSVRVVGLNGEKMDPAVKPIELDVNSKEYRWTPGGRSITFIDRSGIDNLRTMSLVDNKEEAVTDFSSGNISNFLWSNDGKQLFIIRSIFNSDLVIIRDEKRA